jgi:diazepam-binding inhibitor (GABA receptor modulating acyl-CoA-binding protein)
MDTKRGQPLKSSWCFRSHSFQTMPVSDATFKKVADLVGDKNTPAARASTHAEKLRLYGLFKRGTAGRLNPPFASDDIDTDSRKSRPGIFNIDGRMKWDAWAAEDTLSKEEARHAYVELAKEIVGKPVEDVLASD